ncbi:ABC transporter permease subunit, partial [Aeromonas salmonicida]|uniref:ABC transporter permease subunit n=1 Tax=Aeromonas salmonicida TaxID=645 RepID=UPI003D31DA1B
LDCLEGSELCIREGAWVKRAVYGLCGMLSALAGLIVTSRLSSAQPTAGMGYELDAIAAVVLGGCLLYTSP